MPKQTSVNVLIKQVQKDLSLSWVKDGREFDGNSQAVLWSGEGATIKVNGEEVTAFDHYSTDYENYIFGVRKELYNWTDTHGMHWEAHDTGTFFSYRD
jgi:hypothetical protein